MTRIMRIVELVARLVARLVAKPSRLEPWDGLQACEIGKKI